MNESHNSGQKPASSRLLRTPVLCAFGVAKTSLRAVEFWLSVTAEASARAWSRMFANQKSAFEQHERLKAELRIRGTSLAQIGREPGISGTSMSLVGLGKHRSRRIERAIAEALGTTPEKLYPDRYGEEDT